MRILLAPVLPRNVLVGVPGINRADQSEEPTFGGVGLLSHIADEPNLVLDVGQRRFRDVNLECQASPGVPLTPTAQA